MVFLKALLIRFFRQAKFTGKTCSRNGTGETAVPNIYVSSALFLQAALHVIVTYLASKLRQNLRVNFCTSYFLSSFQRLLFITLTQ